MRKVIQWRMTNIDESNEFFEEFRSTNGGKQALPELTKLFDTIEGKVGLIFSETPAFELKPIVEENKVTAPAKVGVIAPIEVVIPAGPSGMDPS